MSQKRVLVIGLGGFGAALVDELFDTGVEIAVIDKDARAIEALKDRVSAAFVADGSDPRVLESVAAQDMDVAVVTYGEDFEATVLAVAALKQLGLPSIVARAATDRQAAVLRSVGATRVVLVEDEMGRRLVPELLSPASAALVEYASSFRVVPWSPPAAFLDKTLGELELVRNHEVSVLGYWRGPAATGARKQRLNLPSAEYRVAAGDTLLLIGLHDAVEKFLAIE